MTYWVIANKATVRVVIGPNGWIIEAAPLVRKFIGQPLANLEYFMHRRFGGIVKTEKGQ